VSVPPLQLRPRSTTEIIDAAVSLLRQHYVELVTATALFTVPLFIFNVIIGSQTGVQGTIGTTPFTVAPQAAMFPARLLPWFFLMMLVAFLLGPLASATTVVIVSDNYLGREVTIAGALARAINRIWTVFFTGLLQGFLIGLGFIAFIIPGFFCIAWFFSAVNIVMVEGKGPTEALGRGRFLAKDSVGRILGTLLLCGIVVAVITALANAIIFALVGTVHASSQVAVVLSNLVNIAIYPFFTVVTTVLYFDLRIRKEGLDLELMAKELGVAVPGAVPA
jgi:hypothetical protein